MPYALTVGTMIARANSDGSTTFIPADPASSDYQAYQAWLAAGNAPTPAPNPAPVIPQQVTDRQFWQACAQLGIIQETEALAMMQTGVIPATLLTAINTLPTADQFSAKMTIIGERIFMITDPLLVLLAAAMSETSVLNAVFTLGATL